AGPARLRAADRSLRLLSSSARRARLGGEVPERLFVHAEVAIAEEAEGHLCRRAAFGEEVPHRGERYARSVADRVAVSAGANRGESNGSQPFFDRDLQAPAVGARENLGGGR